MNSDAAEIAGMLVHHQISRRLFQFALAMDRRDWDTVGELVVDDVTANFGLGAVHGRDALISQMRSFLDHCGPTQHLIGNVLVDHTPTTATSTCYVQDLHVGRGDLADRTFATLGEYRDRWVRPENGAWLLSARTKISHATVGSFDVFEH